MPEVEFTQYLLPDGRRHRVTTEVDEETRKRADEIEARGFRFEIEILTTGHVSMTVSDDDGDYDFRICENGPDVPVCVRSLINDFDVEAAEKQREAGW